MIKFHIVDLIKNPEEFISAALRAYHILLGIAISNGVVPIPEATDAKVYTIDSDLEDVFVHFEDRQGNTITSFELSYSHGGYWYISDYCDDVPAGVAAFNRYAGKQSIRFSDLGKLEETVEQMREIENRKIIKADRAKYGEAF